MGERVFETFLVAQPFWSTTVRTEETTRVCQDGMESANDQWSYISITSVGLTITNQGEVSQIISGVLLISKFPIRAV